MDTYVILHTYAFRQHLQSARLRVLTGFSGIYHQSADTGERGQGSIRPDLWHLLDVGHGERVGDEE